MTLAGLARRWRSRPVPEGIRITKVGLWYVLFTVIVGVAATNTGNNALYLVLAVMLALLVVCAALAVLAQPVLRYTRAAAEALHAPTAYIDAVTATKPVPGPTRPFDGAERAP